MNKEQVKKYTLQKKTDSLIFRTSSFRAEKKSVLHSGIYNKEFSSALSATALSGIVYLFLFLSIRMTALYYLILILIFVAGFFWFRAFVFKERYLEVVFNKSNKTVKITRHDLIRRKIETFSLDNLSSIDVESKKFVPENPDGIKFVEKISIQHGSFIPGLGDEQEFVSLVLKFNDGTERNIYTDKIEGKIGGEPELPLRDIRDFLGK